MYSESVSQRNVQVEGYRKHLGVHPYTAKCLHYHGQGHSRVEMFSSAIDCCLIAHQMYLKLNGDGVQTMRVLSTYGKVLIKSGKIRQGISTLERALHSGETILGEHERVAWCYEQLAQAKMSFSRADADKLKQKAFEMRRKFQIKTLLANRKIYSLQLSVEEVKNYHLFKGEEADDCYYVPFIFIFMFLAFMWHLVMSFYKCECPNN